MGLEIMALTFDCTSAGALAEFWSQALGRPIDAAPPEVGDYFRSIGRDHPEPGKPVMMFIAVPEGKSAKNRLHLDLDCDDRDAEVERLVALGATVVHSKDEWGVSWTTLADPEGNEFCVAAH